ncbi:hypothetical protein U9M48_001850 [Paspalum notatum var. saurae]|uniref:Uncharacterized protein n=1 Tax=Paspalum notatum var. saurae TaxID=547442 RepID=A0AAQ3SFI0_PASNO
MEPVADGQKAEEEVAATAVAPEASSAAGEKPPGPKHVMPKRDIRRILSFEPTAAAPRVYEALKLSNPELVPSPEEEMDEAKSRLYRGAREFYEDIPKLQERVRQELQTNGYVEVDDEWVKGQAAAQARIDETQKRIDELLLQYPQTEDEDDDDDSDGDYSDEDD